MWATFKTSDKILDYVRRLSNILRLNYLYVNRKFIDKWVSNSIVRKILNKKF